MSINALNAPILAISVILQLKIAQIAPRI